MATSSLTAHRAGSEPNMVNSCLRDFALTEIRREFESEAPFWSRSSSLSPSSCTIMAKMRRALSIFLVMFFGLGPLSTMLQADDEVRLPACCRRHGAHHCAMPDGALTRMVASTDRPVLSAPSHCPYYPQGSCASLSSIHALTPSNALHPALLAQNHSPAASRASARVSQLRTRADRGPPTSILA
jgi:hypothetical protein